MGKREAPSTLGVSLSNNAYDVIRWLAQIFLPAFGTLYATVAFIWGLPEADKVVATTVALTLFLGALMNVSKKAYDNDPDKHDGAIIPDFTEDGQPIARVELNPNLDGEALVAKKNLSIKGLSPEGVELLRSQGLSEPNPTV